MAYPGKTKWIAWPAPSVALRHGLALVSVALAFGLTRKFIYFYLPEPFTAFELSAIAITYWYDATKPGILAALLSSLIGSCFFQNGIDTVPRVLYDPVFLVFAPL
jgi:hypothetical protein